MTAVLDAFSYDEKRVTYLKYDGGDAADENAHFCSRPRQRHTARPRPRPRPCTTTVHSLYGRCNDVDTMLSAHPHHRAAYKNTQAACLLPRSYAVPPANRICGNGPARFIMEAQVLLKARGYRYQKRKYFYALQRQHFACSASA